MLKPEKDEHGRMLPRSVGQIWLFIFGAGTAAMLPMFAIALVAGMFGFDMQRYVPLVWGACTIAVTYVMQYTRWH